MNFLKIYCKCFINDFVILSDITGMLSPPTFEDDNLTEQFYGDIEANSLLQPHQSHEDDLTVR